MQRQVRLIPLVDETYGGTALCNPLLTCATFGHLRDE